MADQLAALLVNQRRLEQLVSQHHQQLMDSYSILRQWVDAKFKTINMNIRRYGGSIQSGLARQQPQQQVLQRRGTADGVLPATLGKTPRTLVELWEENQYGIGNRKPAKGFTSTERSNTRHGIKRSIGDENMLGIQLRN
jgi:hypothetical protein